MDLFQRLKPTNRDTNAKTSSITKQNIISTDGGNNKKDNETKDTSANHQHLTSLDQHKNGTHKTKRKYKKRSHKDTSQIKKKTTESKIQYPSDADVDGEEDSGSEAQHHY